MTATLQEAIAAVRDDDTERAQLLAAEVIQDNPDDAHAWYLLSQLVDSDARRAAYLRKTLALDPAHERARAEFAALPAEASAVLGAPVVVAAPEVDVAVAVAAETAAAEAVVTEAVVTEAVVMEPEAWPAAEPAGVPDWLHPLSPEPTPVTVAPSYEPVPVASIAPPAPAPAPATSAPGRQTTPPPPPRQQGHGALMALLVLLGLLTLAVLAILAFLLFF